MRLETSSPLFRYAMITAVLLGLAVGWFVQDFVASPSGSVAEVPTVVAACQIPAGTVLSPETVRVIMLPAASVPPKSARSIHEVLGRLTKFTLMPGEPILMPRLVPGEQKAQKIRLPVVSALGDYVVTWYADLCYLKQRFMTGLAGKNIL